MGAAAKLGVVGAGLFLISFLPSTAYAFDQDTHYVLTYYLARKVGYSADDAWRIASAALAVDLDPNTEPFQTAKVPNPFEDAQDARVKYHAFLDSRAFSRDERDSALAGQREQQDALWRQALATGNPGQYLHFMQDTYSHQDLWSFAGQLTTGHEVDFLAYDEARTRDMVLETMGDLGRFMAQKRELAVRPRTLDGAEMNEVWSVVETLSAVNPLPGPVANYDPNDWFTTGGAPNWRRARRVVEATLKESLPDPIPYGFDQRGRPDGLDASWDLPVPLTPRPELEPRDEGEPTREVADSTTLVIPFDTGTPELPPPPNEEAVAPSPAPQDASGPDAAQILTDSFAGDDCTKRTSVELQQLIEAATREFEARRAARDPSAAQYSRQISLAQNCLGFLQLLRQ